MAYIVFCDNRQYFAKISNINGHDSNMKVLDGICIVKQKKKEKKRQREREG